MLKLGTTWPLPPELIKKNLSRADKILFVEEVLPFTEENVKILAAEMAAGDRDKEILRQERRHHSHDGRDEPGHRRGRVRKDPRNTSTDPMPAEYEATAQEMIKTLAPVRDLTFCPGCPHRASFWNIHNALAMDNREGFVCGDIGCYTLGFLPCGFSTMKTSHSMGSGIGIASGFGKLGQFGMDQPIVTVCGDSTFFHAAIPALVNAVHNRSDVIFILLDNSGTAMTGFQPHPGTPLDATGHELPDIDPAAVCRSLGATVEYADPFDIDGTQAALLRLLDEGGARVLIMKQMCALSPAKKGKKMFEVRVDENVCIGENCGCNRFCTRIFRCPGLVWDRERGVAVVDEVICAGCGVCASICPSGAIRKTEARA